VAGPASNGVRWSPPSDRKESWGLLAADLLQRQLATFLVQLLEAVEAVAAVAIISRISASSNARDDAYSSTKVRPDSSRLVEQIVAQHVVEAMSPGLVGIAADVDALDEFHLLFPHVFHIDIDV